MRDREMTSMALKLAKKGNESVVVNQAKKMIEHKDLVCTFELSSENYLCYMNSITINITSVP